MGVYIKDMDMPKTCAKCFVGDRTICSVGCPITDEPESLPSTNNWIEKVFQEKLGIKTANEILSSEEELGNWIERMLWHVNRIDDDNWIPVSERLPDAEYGEGDSVLCCTESGLMYILYWDGGNWRVPTGEPHHWVNHKTGWHDKVIAWMPLPKPYKESEVEE